MGGHAGSDGATILCRARATPRISQKRKPLDIKGLIVMRGFSHLTICKLTTVVAEYQKTIEVAAGSIAAMQRKD